MKKKLPTILLILFFIVGLLVMLYPTISNWYNERMNSYVVSDYNHVIDEKKDEDFQTMFKRARDYNEKLHSLPQQFNPGTPYDKDYINSLNVLNGMMGYVVIDKINVNTPIYHGTDESVLQHYVGHLEGSSLPTGDIGNNTVITGHTGLPSAELFTDLNKLEIGDTFQLYILNEIFTYEVFDISVVLPHEVDNLKAVDTKDIVTLITCTPYGINSHRLLVQGEQIKVAEVTPKPSTAELVVPETKTFDFINFVPFVAILIIVFLVIFIISKFKKSR